MHLKKARTVGILSVLTFAQALVLFSATPSSDRDNGFYQAFTEALAGGTLDLTIHGFHGAGFFAALWHLVHPSELSHIQFQMFCALLLPVIAYLTLRRIFRSEAAGILAACGVVMMPFWWLVALIGYTGASYMCALLLTMLLASHRSRFLFLPLAVAILIKPFAVALLPVVVVLWKDGKDVKAVKDVKDLWVQIGLGLLLPALYVIIQYLQAGHIIVGVHPEFDQSNIWQSPRKIFLNGALALQILFSVHNYHYPDPGGTGHDNMLHTTPLLIVFGLWAAYEHAAYFKDRRLPYALCLGALLCFGLNAVIGTMDHYYMDAGVLLLVIAAVPLLLRHPFWVAPVLATLHFQWFYAALRYRELLHLGYLPLLLPAVVDLVFLLWAAGKCREFWRCRL